MWQWSLTILTEVPQKWCPWLPGFLACLYQQSIFQETLDVWGVNSPQLYIKGAAWCHALQRKECNYLAADSCVFLRQLFTLSVPWLLFWTLVSFCEYTSSFSGRGGLGEWWSRCRVLVCTAPLQIYLFITCGTLVLHWDFWPQKRLKTIG